MPFIKDIQEEWSAPVLLATDEIWQVRAGRVLVTTEAITDNDQGIELIRGDAVEYAAGKSVRYRSSMFGPAAIYRETR